VISAGYWARFEDLVQAARAGGNESQLVRSTIRFGMKLRNPQPNYSSRLLRRCRDELAQSGTVQHVSLIAMCRFGGPCPEVDTGPA
jgi:hypothetical protein